jgi:hypothetical protein
LRDHPVQIAAHVGEHDVLFGARLERVQRSANHPPDQKTRLVDVAGHLPRARRKLAPPGKDGRHRLHHERSRLVGPNAPPSGTASFF